MRDIEAGNAIADELFGDPVATVSRPIKELKSVINHLEPGRNQNSFNVDYYQRFEVL